VVDGQHDDCMGRLGHGGLSGTGGRYSPGTDSWLPVTTVNAQLAAYYANSVWTGSEMIVWGGTPPGSTAPGITGGRYNP